MMPQLWVFAGPNGSGKSTLTGIYAARHGVPVIVNADTIAQVEGLSPIQAGKKALRLQNHYLSEKMNFAVETTLSGNHELSLMQTAQDSGYKVNMVYVCVENPMIAIGRISQRVRDGGHFVPQEDVIRRYERSLNNLEKALGLSDRAFLLDNTSKRYRLLLTQEYGSIRHMAKNFPEWAKPIEAKLSQKHEASLSLSL